MTDGQQQVIEYGQQISHNVAERPLDLRDAAFFLVREQMRKIALRSGAPAEA